MTDALNINTRVRIPIHEIELHAIRAQGPGGQNVNKVSSAIHLRFDVKASSLSEYHKTRVLACRDRRITEAGVIVIKAQSSRTQAQNKQDALERLAKIVKDALVVQKFRKATKPTWGSVKRRREDKSRRSHLKSTRGKVNKSDD
ncbi:MAG: class I peptide chain release factor [Robiginitomaculum sp.]|nr:MAG: class I peptide chain release factor [Robiginitomaculum sp.]